jgi:hypothetical protein
MFRMLAFVALLAAAGGTAADTIELSPWPLDAAAEDAILALDPERLSAEQVRYVLAKAPAPRVMSFKGSLPGVSMDSFAAFLIAMGYPADRLRNPKDDSFTYGVREDSAEVVGAMAWWYEREGMVSMLVGHSGGGVVVNRVLYDLADAAADAKTFRVWNPERQAFEARSSVRDPIDGNEVRIAELRVPYATMFATGYLLRIFGQLDDVPRLRKIPGTVDEFTGFQILWDPIAGTGGDPAMYEALPAARPAVVRNVLLPATTSHIRAFAMEDLVRDARAHAWIDSYRPDTEHEPLPRDADVDVSNLLPAADIWHSVKKHWCLEAQRLIRAHRSATTAPRN